MKHCQNGMHTAGRQWAAAFPVILCLCYGIVCGASYAASLNLILCFFLNLWVQFFLVFLLTDKFNPKAYFLYGMEFVFLQLRLIPAQAMPARLCAFLYAIAVLTAFLYLHSRIIKKKGIIKP